MREPFDPDVERAFVRDVLLGDAVARQRLAERLACVRPILAARNARFGAPLDVDDVRDLCQEVYRIVAWVHGICCLQLQAALRRRAVWRRRATSIDGDVTDARDDRGAEDVAGRVHDLLSRIGGMEALVIRLRHLDDLSCEQIAARLGLKLNTVRSHLARGMIALRRRAADSRSGQDAP
jgi:RNA polymerase sigma factor (sigma-70 family)